MRHYTRLTVAELCKLGGFDPINQRNTWLANNRDICTLKKQIYECESIAYWQALGVTHNWDLVGK